MTKSIKIVLKIRGFLPLVPVGPAGRRRLRYRSRRLEELDTSARLSAKEKDYQAEPWTDVSEVEAELNMNGSNGVEGPHPCCPQEEALSVLVSPEIS